MGLCDAALSHIVQRVVQGRGLDPNQGNKERPLVFAVNSIGQPEWEQ